MKYYKVKWDKVPLLDEISVQEQQQLNQRNKFHNFPTNQWLKKRSEHAKPEYLYYPEERRLQIELKQIFKTLDCKNQGVLTLSHIFFLFKHFGFNVNSNDLQKIYQYIDQDQDQALSLDEFKGLAENPNALMAFRNMMTKIQKTMEYDEKYIPFSVGAMLNHLSYLVKREKQLKVIMSEKSIQAKFLAFRQLVQETDKKTLADEAFQLYLQAQAELNKTIKRQNSVDVKIKVRKSFSTINGLQPLIFRNMLMKDADELQELARLIRMQSKVQIDSIRNVSEALDESSLSNIEQIELDQVILKAQQQGKAQAKKEIQAMLMNQNEHLKLNFMHKKTLSLTKAELTPVKVNISKCHSTKNKSLLERELKLQRIIGSEDLMSFNFLSSSRSNKNQLSTQEYSTYENQGGWSNRILSLKLPTLQ